MKNHPRALVIVLGLLSVSATGCVGRNSDDRSDTPADHATTTVQNSRSEGINPARGEPSIEDIDKVTAEGASLESVYDILGDPIRVDHESDGLQLLHYEFDSLFLQEDADATHYLNGLLVIAKEGRVLNALSSSTSIDKGPSDRELVFTNVTASIQFVALAKNHEHHELEPGEPQVEDVDELTAAVGRIQFDGIRRLSFDPPPPAEADGERSPMGSLELELFESDYNRMASFTGEHIDEYVMLAIDSKVIAGGVVRVPIESGIFGLPVSNSPALLEILATFDTR